MKERLHQQLSEHSSTTTQCENKMKNRTSGNFVVGSRLLIIPKTIRPDVSHTKQTTIALSVLLDRSAAIRNKNARSGQN